jgi:perosamine synthetase
MRSVAVGTFTVSETMRRYVQEVLDSGRISYGPFSRDLEAQMAEIHECDYGVLSNSGTSSLQVALQGLKELNGWADGDEVLVPSVTFVATVNIVVHCRMMPVLVDVEPDFYGMNPAKVEAAITSKTRAMIPVHLFGMPSDLLHLSMQCSEHGLKMIEDSCECMFAGHEGRSVGSWGDVSCFSTYVAHLITSGVGGLSLTNDEELAIRMRSLVNHGRDNIYISIDDDDGLRGAAMREVVGRRMRFHHFGHSFRITELEAALALAQLQTWEEMIRRRREIAEYLTIRLSEFPQLQLPALRPNTEHSWMMYPIVVRGKPKWELVHHLEANGIETRDMLPITNQPVYSGWVGPGDFPVADMINECGFYIGSHQDLEKEDLDYVAECVAAFYNRP